MVPSTLPVKEEVRVARYPHMYMYRTFNPPKRIREFAKTNPLFHMFCFLLQQVWPLLQVRQSTRPSSPGALLPESVWQVLVRQAEMVNAGGVCGTDGSTICIIGRFIQHCIMQLCASEDSLVLNVNYFLPITITGIMFSDIFVYRSVSTSLLYRFHVWYKELTFLCQQRDLLLCRHLLYANVDFFFQSLLLILHCYL